MSNVVFDAAADKKPGAEFGDLPQWDLSDLYPGADSDEIKADIAFCEQEAKQFAKDYKASWKAWPKMAACLKRLRDLKRFQTKWAA